MRGAMKALIPPKAPVVAFQHHPLPFPPQRLSFPAHGAFETQDARADDLCVDPLDGGDRLFELMDTLLDELERTLLAGRGTDDPAHDPAWRSGDLAAGAMLEFKGRYGDGRLGHWTAADVEEFLLRWFPRAVVTDEEVVHDLPECACAFLRFLDERGSLRGDPLPALERACRAAAPTLRATYREVPRSGAAGTLERLLRKRR